MPFKTAAEAALLKHRYPKLYRKWRPKFGAPTDLPRHVKHAHEALNHYYGGGKGKR